jgi:hypothetical protein
MHVQQSHETAVLLAADFYVHPVLLTTVFGFVYSRFEISVHTGTINDIYTRDPYLMAPGLE